MIFITGDTHRRFNRIEYFSKKYNTKKSDTMIILGDAGINYCGNPSDYEFKEYLHKIQLTFFCIHGNHEMRPQTIPTYQTKIFYGGEVYYEEEFPTILFAKDGEIYTFNNKDCLVVGGAYSVDKYYRLQMGYKWWADELPSGEIKKYVEQTIELSTQDLSYVFSHTCPANYIPTETFLSTIDQSTVDKSMENWLQEIENKISYEKWFCGHYHTNKVDRKIKFLYNDIIELP